VDYDEEKIRVARRTAPAHRRVRFELRDILNWEYPPCDTILLMDVLHYWTLEKQQRILCQARHALRPGGRLILREAAREDSEAHRRVARWETFATRIGHNRTSEGLNFQSLAELQAALIQAGFKEMDVRPSAGQDSNRLVVARI
jgi:SAM-dependent methyltransferase